MPEGEEAQVAPQAPQTPVQPPHRPSATNVASDKQKTLLAQLLQERGLSPETYGISLETVTALEASDLITKLFKMPKKPKEEPKVEVVEDNDPYGGLPF